jgi:hypothetical protein
LLLPLAAADVVWPVSGLGTASSMTVPARVNRLRDVAEQVDRLPRTAARNLLLYEIRARIVALDTHAEFRVNRWSGPAHAADSLAPLILER